MYAYCMQVWQIILKYCDIRLNIYLIYNVKCKHFASFANLSLHTYSNATPARMTQLRYDISLQFIYKHVRYIAWAYYLRYSEVMSRGVYLWLFTAPDQSKYYCSDYNCELINRINNPCSCFLRCRATGSKFHLATDLHNLYTYYVHCTVCVKSQLYTIVKKYVVWMQGHNIQLCNVGSMLKQAENFQKQSVYIQNASIENQRLSENMPVREGG